MFFSDDTQDLSSSKPPPFRTTTSQNLRKFDTKTIETDDWVFIEEKKNVKQFLEEISNFFQTQIYPSYQSNPQQNFSNFQQNQNPYLLYPSSSEILTSNSQETLKFEKQNQIEKNNNYNTTTIEPDICTKELPNFDFSYEKNIINNKNSFNDSKSTEINNLQSNMYIKEPIKEIKKNQFNPELQKAQQVKKKKNLF